MPRSPRPASPGCFATPTAGRSLRCSLNKPISFVRHLQDQLGGRPRALVVDTGLFGTTAHLLADAQPDLEFSSVLIARSNYRREPTPWPSKVFGISVQVDGYSPLQRRTAILRYWHFTEALFEPALPSVRSFSAEQGRPVQTWRLRGGRNGFHRLRVLPTPAW